MSNYRVTVSWDPGRSVFVARAPELEHCSAEGKTRAEAMTALEEEIEAQLRNMREQGSAPPPALDEDDASLSGEIAAKVSRGLHRELILQARSEGVELEKLVGEMLAAGLDARRAAAARGGRRAPAPGAGREPGNEAQPRGPGPRPGGFGGRDPRGQGGRYHAIMEDRATFLEYVRGLESGGGGPPRGGGGGPRGRDRGRGRGRPPGAGPGPGNEPSDDDEGASNK
jgi:predicted RNase H-like HicB family nuclease